MKIVTKLKQVMERPLTVQTKQVLFGKSVLNVALNYNAVARALSAEAVYKLLAVALGNGSVDEKLLALVDIKAVVGTYDKYHSAAGEKRRAAKQYLNYLIRDARDSRGELKARPPMPVALLERWQNRTAAQKEGGARKRRNAGRKRGKAA